MKPEMPKSGPSKLKELSDHGINPETVEEHPNEEGEPQTDITHTTGNIFCFSTDNVVLDNKAA